ncbi:Leucine-rich repeat protein kinase family protein [Raphanus sativus]|nr:Leucine-rich repeat protein kinase family protein [Raphanus sativus]
MTIAKVLICLLCFIALVYAQPSPDLATMNALRDSLKFGKDFSWTGPDPCKWSGVQCDTSNRITRIQIGNKGISGTLTSDLNTLSSLTVFEVMGNMLTGALPSLAGLTALETIYAHDNSFTSISVDIFTGLTSLQHVFLDDNPFSPWEIPMSLKSATSLVDFSAANCSLSGKIPEFLGGQTFPSLQKLRLSSNSLSGELPLSFADSPVQTLLLNGQKQKLNGSISVLQNMTSLTEVSLQANAFSGPLPDMSRLVSLTKFNVRENQLTGLVPSSFTELQSLAVVNLTNNLLQGSTPTFKAKNIATDITPRLNSFCLDSPGVPCDPRVNILLSIAEAFGYPVRFAQSWKGNDPCSSKNIWVGITCTGDDITVINFKGMGLNGAISPRFADLTSLRVINLSQNNLTGVIPQELTKLSSLTTLDVSNNQLYGKVPVFGPNVLITTGNPDLGKDGPGHASGSFGSNAGKVVGSVFGVVLGLLLIGLIVFLVVKKRKLNRKKYPQKHSGEEDALKITIDNLCAGGSESGSNGLLVEAENPVKSIQELREATDNFNEKNILGRGGFGIVYKGELQNGKTIAVKRMESSVISGKGLDEFKSEIAVLTKVRHRNLVRLEGYCFEGNERLLVYEYMPQGTLSSHILHWQEEGLKPLEWSRRLIIATDVAKGVEYLHSQAQQSFIHRDLKSTNILLGDDMRARVADFGLVRLAPEGTQSVETKIAGTFGYLAPEYAVTGRVTTKVDVYSFGVILMELLTGRKALDIKRSEEDVHLATWFRRMFINRDSFHKAIDATIETNEETLRSINKVAELASHCSAREPHQRPDMSHVANVLASLLDQWKPDEDIYGIDYDTPPPLLEMIERTNNDSSFFGDNSMTSIPSRPRQIDNTFQSGQGR